MMNQIKYNRKKIIASSDRFFKFDSVYKKELFKNIQTKRIIYFQMKKEALADFPTKASFNMEYGYEA